MKLYTKKLLFAIAFCLLMVGVKSQITWNGAGATNNFSEGANWVGGVAPTTIDDAIFDGTSTKNCDFDQFVDVNNFSMLTGYTGVITDLGFGCNINGDFTQDDGTISTSVSFDVVGTSNISSGTFNGNASAITLGIFNLLGGTFNAGSNICSFSGAGTVFAGTFNGNSAAVSFNTTFNQSSGTFNATTANLDISGNVTISGGAVFNGLASTIYFGAAFTLSGGTFNSTSGVLTTEGNSFTRTGGTFVHNGGTVVCDRLVATTFVFTGTITFNIITLTASNALSSIRPINFNASITTSVLNLNGLTKPFRYLGNIAITSQLNINGTNVTTPTPNTAIFRFTGAGPFTITGAGAAARNKLGNITMNNTGNVTMSGHINLTGTWLNTLIGSFTGGASTVNFYGTAGLITAGTTATTRAYFDNLTVQSASTLGITNGSYVDLNGNFTHIGTFNGNTTLLMFTGAAAQTINGTAVLTTINAIEQTGAGGLSFGHATNLLDSIRISGGPVTLTNLTLKSTSALKGRIAEISGGGSVAGNVTVETLIPGGNTDWANLGASGVSGLTFNSWYGQIPMAIEGSATGVTSAGGYFESVWRWDETDAFGYDSTVTVTDPINVGQGYWLYVGNGPTTTGDLMTTVNGPAVSGSQALPLSTVQTGDCLLANPFASPISWERIYADDPLSTTGVIYIYNADAGTTSAYSAITDITTPAGSGANSTIPMGQGFYVVANVGFPTLTIDESHKVSDNTGADPLLKTNPNTSAAGGVLIRLKIEDGYGYWDDAAILFHSSTTSGYDNGYDARKFFSSPGYVGYPGAYTKRTSISTKIGTGDYCINSLPLPLLTNAVIPVLAKVMATGQHTISGVSLNNLPPGTCVDLKDKLLNVTHNLLSGPYVCNINDSTSAARFELTVCANITMGVNDTPPVVAETVFVKHDANGVYVDLNFEKNTSATITANNILGQEIMSPKQVECTSGKYYLDLYAKEQIIMVNVITQEKRYTQKIFVPQN